jgi:tripartite-type tricarboxylate transporter receptor subunit TctC
LREVLEVYDLDGTEATPGTPEAMTAYIDNEIKKWARVVKISGAKPE